MMKVTDRLAIYTKTIELDTCSVEAYINTCISDLKDNGLEVKYNLALYKLQNNFQEDINCLVPCNITNFWSPFQPHMGCYF